MNVTRIISGGQAGADRGGLDAAMQLGLQIGGFVPRGRRAEDGEVPRRYTGMVETLETNAYHRRTRLNVQHSDATVIVYGGQLGPGSLLTIRIAHTLARPLLVLCVAAPDAREQLARFIGGLEGQYITLNIAGSRESSFPGIQRAVRDLVVNAVMSLRAEDERQALGGDAR